MSLQNECSIEKGVTIRAAKRLEDCINFAHVAYMVVISQQSQSILLLLQTSSSKVFDNIPIHNIYKNQQNVQSQQILNNKNILHVDSLELIGAQFVHFIDQRIESVCSFFFQSSAMQVENKHKKGTRYGYVVVLFFLRT